MVNIKFKKKLIQSYGDLIFDIVKYIFLGLLVLLCIFPFINVISLSFSHGGTIVSFLPKEITFASYIRVLTKIDIWNAFGISLFTTVAVVVLSTSFMALAAFPLSKQDFPFRKGILMFFLITMLFSAGAVPAFCLYSAIGVYNTVWVLIICSLMNVYNMILLKTFFENMPQELEDAAKIDGASDIQMFIKIIVPLSVPIIAVCVFFTSVGMWNGYSAALYFVPTNVKDQPLAFYVYHQVSSAGESSDPLNVLWIHNFQSALIIFATLPIIITYPFITKYLKTGLMIGSVKG